MNYYIDTEFIEYPHTIQLISLGIVCEDGREKYWISREFDTKKVWKEPWLKENVVPYIFTNGIIRKYNPESYRGFKRLIKRFGQLNYTIAHEVIDFCRGHKDSSDPVFYGYYADYDWLVFCWLFGRMIDLPKSFPMYCRDLKQMQDDFGIDSEIKNNICPNQEGEHNALVDARWNKKFHDVLRGLRHSTP